MTSRPAAPESSYPTIERLADLSQTTTSYQGPALVEEAVRCWRQLALVETMNKGHVRIEDELKEENTKLRVMVTKLRVMVDECHDWLEDTRRKSVEAQARIAELEKLLREIMVCPRSDPNRGKGRWFSVMAKTDLVERIDAALKSRA
jgi:hypothetical protein